jgi:hypothetical protein
VKKGASLRSLKDPRPLLEHLEETASGEAADEGLFAALAFVAAQDVRLPEHELDAARRRSMLLLAAGADPHRALELDGRAVRALADDLDAEERRDELAAALAGVRTAASGLERVTLALDRLRADDDLAWRWLACALLAEEISGEGDD